MLQPVCPYCGELTRVQEIAPMKYATVCPKCSAQGPTVKGIGGKIALREKALIKAIAFAREVEA